MITNRDVPLARLIDLVWVLHVRLRDVSDVDLCAIALVMQAGANPIWCAGYDDAVADVLDTYLITNEYETAYVPALLDAMSALMAVRLHERDVSVPPHAAVEQATAVIARCQRDAKELGSMW